MDNLYLCLQCGSRLAGGNTPVDPSGLQCPVCGGHNLVAHSADSFLSSLLHGSGGG